MSSGVFAQKFESEKTLGILANLFGELAIFISCLGLFGLILFTTEQRNREIGIRKVLGASLGQLMILVSKDFVIFVLLAAIIACPIAYHLMKGWLKDFDYRITLGWGVFVFALLMALIIALISVSWQAWKSASANPVEALKYE